MSNLIVVAPASWTSDYDENAILEFCRIHGIRPRRWQPGHEWLFEQCSPKRKSSIVALPNKPDNLQRFMRWYCMRKHLTSSDVEIVNDTSVGVSELYPSKTTLNPFTLECITNWSLGAYSEIPSRIFPNGHSRVYQQGSSLWETTLTRKSRLCFLSRFVEMSRPDRTYCGVPLCRHSDAKTPLDAVHDHLHRCCRPARLALLGQLLQTIVDASRIPPTVISTVVFPYLHGYKVL